jgi:peroxidase
MAKLELWELEAREDNGSDNNVSNDAWGQAGTPLLRRTGPASYSGDDPQTAAPNDGARDYPVHNVDANGNPIPLKIEIGTGQADFINEAVRTTQNIPNSYGNNELTAFYGQFITHDLTASAIPVPGITPAELFPDPALAGTPMDGINRTPGAVVNGVLEQTNGVSHYLDLGAVYGSGGILPTNTGGTTTVNDVLRNVSADPVEHAKLLTGANGGLPNFAELLAQHPEAIPAAWGPGLGNFGGQPTALVGGDARMTQQPFLAAIHTVWLKEHNYQVDQLASKYATEIASGEISSDELFNMARTIAEAEHQNIIYKEYLAAIIGKENVPEFSGYDPTVNAGIDNTFTTVAFRFGHDQQSETVALVDANGNTVSVMGLAQAFLSTTSQLRAAGGLEDVLRGLETQKAQEVDGKLVASLIDNVLSIPGLNLNLGLLDNVRASDHGIGTLNQVRAQLGLDQYTSWAKFGKANGVAADVLAKLQEYYGHIDNVDPWVGGLLEKAVGGSQLGATFQMLIIAQFEATMAGDRFYFENRLQDFPELIADIKGVTFADITMRNSGVDHIHADSFHVANTISGNGASQKLVGADDDNYLDADNIIGGGGNDSIYGKDGSDTLWGDDGDDLLEGANGDDHLYGGAGNDKANGGAGDDIVHGGDGNDTITLGTGHDWADGEVGNDTINGGDGCDIVLGKAGDDTLTGGANDDQLFGGDGKDTLDGGAENDLVYGGAGDDVVKGGAGDDIIAGEGGNDKLYGGADDDFFVFAKGSGQDTIQDFNFYIDKIDVSAFGYDDIGDLTITTQGSVTTVDFGDGDSVALIGVKKAAQLADVFIFDQQDEAAIA